MENSEVEVNPAETEDMEVNVTEPVTINDLNTIKEDTNSKHKFVRLPLARVKAIMKKEPNCTMISSDAVFLVTKVTEMFIEFLAKEAVKQVGTRQRKTLMRKDVDNAIESCSPLCFLDGALD
ncbi:hypothetical protein NQ318_008254 [Aromia moschata]|uniref:Transcription factor CBF/NF-Y/archaeal histone domain-containing protein n=1 Tax=Aromia moschata TaxID=1265417 RepID=A0AAV8Y7M2_9CUCU|nr:hypothetical protein NQ318_008254 [Aromia moschata]